MSAACSSLGTAAGDSCAGCTPSLLCTRAGPSHQRRLARLCSHILLPALDFTVAAAESGNTGDPFADVATEPITWTRALGAFPLTYRDGPLSHVQWRQFWEDGWTVVTISPGAVDFGALHAKIEECVDANVHALIEGGQLTEDQRFADSDVFTRQAQIEAIVPGSSGALSAEAAPALMFSDAMRHTVGDPTMLGIARQLTGAPEIILPSNYALRCKGPSAPVLDAGMLDGGTVPWHQDCCYVMPEAQDTVAITVWMPLCDATACNGTMQYIRGGHIGAHQDRSLKVSESGVGGGGRTLEHVRDPTGLVKIEENNLPVGEVVTVEVEQGQCIVTSNIMPHRSLPNHSDEMRWSIDWRWQDYRLSHGWARNQPAASWSGVDGGCYRIEVDEGWQVIAGPDPAACKQHPWCWFDDDGVYHRS